MRNNNYGWKKDLPDDRDLKYKSIKPTLTSIPSFVDLKSQCSKIEDQGSLGSCTAQALVGNLEYIEKTKTNMSRLFVYYNERVIENSEDDDAGAYLRDGIKTLNKQGVCAEFWWPYNTSKVTFKPWFWCYWIGIFHKIKSYHAIDGLEEMKTCLAEGFPFVFGFTVFESFESEEVAKTGILPMPKKFEQVVGGHAVMAVGYDDFRQVFIIRNSWGEGWGNEGYFYMPYAYITDKNLCDDFWTIRQ